MDVECTADVPSHIWEGIVSQDPNSYYFHTPAWAKIIERTYGYGIATRLYTIDGLEFLIPMMRKEKYGLNLLLSMPHGYGNIFSPINKYFEFEPRYISPILDNIVKDSRTSLNLATSPFFNLAMPENVLKRNIVNNSGSVHVIPLEGGFDHVWEHRIKNKKAIRKAKKYLTVREGSCIEDYEEYYGIYTRSSEQWGYKVPPQPFELYENMLRYGSSNVKLYLAYKDEKPVAGLVCLYYGNNVFAFTSCYLKEYSNLRAQNLLTCHSIKYASENGYKYFDFGSSRNDPGIIRFKESFGPDVISVKRYIIMAWPFNSLISTTYNLSRKLKTLF